MISLKIHRQRVQRMLRETHNMQGDFESMIAPTPDVDAQIYNLLEYLDDLERALQRIGVVLFQLEE